MTKTTIELLREAREWLALEEHWCAGTFTSDTGGKCAFGALVKFGLCMPEAQTGSIHRLAEAARLLEPDRLRYVTDGPSVVWFNDVRGWSPTLEMFDLAIKLEQEEMDRQAKELVESCSASAQSASVGEAVAK